MDAGNPAANGRDPRQALDPGGDDDGPRFELIRSVYRDDKSTRWSGRDRLTMTPVRTGRPCRTGYDST